MIIERFPRFVKVKYFNYILIELETKNKVWNKHKIVYYKKEQS